MAQFPLIDQASLLMIPGAYKEGKIYSQLPTDGSGDFTYTRGTDTATRVNENGLIEKERVNLLLQSNAFTSSPWTNYLITNPTSGQTGYDGTNDAWLIEANSTSNFPGVRQAKSTNGINVLSVYAKAGTTDYLGFYSSAGFVGFELTGNGGVGTIYGNGVLGHIELISNGWYRCSIVLDGNVSTAFIGPRNTLNSFSADIGDNIYIQDTQLEQGLVATDYIETTTVPVYAGLTDNMPRLDYTDATCPSLLLEPSRTNLIKQSEWMGGLTLQEISVDVDNTVSPEGYANVSKITSLNISSKITNSGIPYVAGTTYTFSAWVKNIDASTVQFLWYDGSSNRVYKENEVNTETFTRISFSFTPSNTISGQIQIARDLPAGQSFYVYGAQLEQGSYPTSYIPTYGSSQTRAADVSSVAKAVSSEGSLFINVGGTSQPKLSVLGEYFDASTTANKVAIAYSSTALVISHNGSIVVDKTGTYDVSSLTQIQLGHSNGSDQADSPISEFVTFDSFLTNSELNALTQ